MRVRAEWFGGLVELGPDIVAVNRAAMRALGVPAHGRWAGADPGRLSAPVDAQLLLSTRCTVGCGFCSVAATADGPALGLDEGRRILDELARRGVFRVAFGGGEPLEHPHLLALAAHARAVGLVPTMTTSGAGLTPALAAACRVFAAVHVSWRPGGPPALALMRAHHDRVGVNVIVDAQSARDLVAVAACAVRLRLSCMQLLALRRAGRSARSYRPTAGLVDVVRGIVREQRVAVRVDACLARAFGIEPRGDLSEVAGVHPMADDDGPMALVPLPS